MRRIMFVCCVQRLFFFFFFCFSFWFLTPFLRARLFLEYERTGDGSNPSLYILSSGERNLYIWNIYMNGTIRAFTMIRRVNGVDAVINTWDSYYKMSCRHICRETPGNLRYTSVIVTRSRQESRERETDFLKNCSDLINKKRNKRCLRQLTSAIVTFLLDFLLVYFSIVEREEYNPYKCCRSSHESIWTLAETFVNIPMYL